MSSMIAVRTAAARTVATPIKAIAQSAVQARFVKHWRAVKAR